MSMETETKPTTPNTTEVTGETMTSVAHDGASTLRAEVLDLIASYAAPNAKPHPFTTEELLVIAIIGLGEPAVRTNQIFRFLCERFRCINDRLVDVFVRQCNIPDYCGPERYDTNIDGFGGALQQYEVPIRRISPDPQTTEDSAAPVGEGDDPGPSETWSLTGLCEARVFLNRHLEPQRQGTFRFLDLPGELRSTIYGYVLSYPCLDFQRSWPFLSFSVAQAHPTLDWHNGPWLPPLSVRPVDKILAITHVSKQVYRESLTVFFDINIFRCQQLGSLDSFVRTLHLSNPEQFPNRSSLCPLEPIRFQCLRTLQMSYSYGGGYYEAPIMSEVIGMLAAAKGLRHITVEVYDSQWLDDWHSHWDKPEDLPGIELLVQLLHQVRDYKLIEGGGRTEKYLDSELRRLE